MMQDLTVVIPVADLSNFHLLGNSLTIMYIP